MYNNRLTKKTCLWNYKENETNSCCPEVLNIFKTVGLYDNYANIQMCDVKDIVSSNNNMASECID